MREAESKGDVARDLPATDGRTPTPWEYRPHRYDDWGWIRGPMAEGDSIGPIVATARSGQYENEDALNVHRRAGTDPYGANAAFIVNAVNNHDALVKALQQIEYALRKDSFCDAERIESARQIVVRILSAVGETP